MPLTLQIPLARDDARRQRNFTPWDLASLQEVVRDRTHQAFRRRQRFRERRRVVVSRFLSPRANVVVRGCRFGQSREGLQALGAAGIPGLRGQPDRLRSSGVRRGREAALSPERARNPGDGSLGVLRHGRGGAPATRLSGSR